MNAGERLPGTPSPMHWWTTASGLRFAADAWGDPRSSQVLLGHGGGQTRHAWGATARQLGTAGHFAIAYDARGHGDTDWPDDGDYSTDAQIHGLQGLIHKLGDRRPTLIGASLSAEIFLVGVGEGAVEASALVLVDFAPSTREEGYQRNKAFMEAHAHGFASLEEAGDAIASHRGGERPPRLDGLAKVLRQRADGRYYWHWDPRMIDWRVREYPNRHARMAAAARHLKVPTLLVRGGQSDVLSEEGAREFLALAPHAEYLVIPEAGHMIASDANDRFGAATLDFLRRVTT